MRVIVHNSPGHPDSRGYVVSHVGLNVDRWWEELKNLDEDDQEFFEGLVTSSGEFLFSRALDEGSSLSEVNPRRKFLPDMVVLEEMIAHYVQQKFLPFLPEDATAFVDDGINTLALRGIEISNLGVTREQLEQKIRQRSSDTALKGKVLEQPVQPQKARQVARLWMKGCGPLARNY